MEKVSVKNIQNDLALDSAQTFKTEDIPYYKDVLNSVKEVEKDRENFKNYYDPNKSVYSNNG